MIFRLARRDPKASRKTYLRDQHITGNVITMIQQITRYRPFISLLLVSR